MPRGNLKNLTQFQKGVSGNPGGRPRNSVRLAKSVESVLAQPAAPEILKRLNLPPGTTGASALATRLLQLAIFHNSVHAARVLATLSAETNEANLSATESTGQSDEIRNAA